MRHIGCFALAVLLLACSARAQCTGDWLPGAGLSGVDGIINAVTAWDPDGPGPLPARLVVGGAFSLAGRTPVSNVAWWDGAAWHTMGSGLDGSVACLLVHNGEVYAAGRFTHSGAAPVSLVARWDGAAWQPLGSGLA